MTSDGVRWKQMPIGEYEERWVAFGPGKEHENDWALRILKKSWLEGDHWCLRFEKENDTTHEEPLPPGMTLEEMQAYALTVWRMR